MAAKVDNLSDQSKSADILSEENQETIPTCSKLCPSFGDCSANLCPLDLIPNAIWYPFEDICTLRAFSSLPWVKQQRKIARKARNVDFFFNYEMLCRNCVITVATEGLDPDKTEINDERALELWLSKHPAKRELSEEGRETVRNRLAPFRHTSTPVQKDQMAIESEGISIIRIEVSPSSDSKVPKNIYTPSVSNIRIQK